jgi:two-component flavin-dependent monooxygenase
LARSSAEIDAAALLLERAAWRADTAAVSAAAVARNRRDAAFAADLLVSAVERLFRTGGRHARSNSGSLQRCWRDVHTAAAHGVLRMETAADAYASAVCA